MKVTGHKNTDRGERRAADSQIAPKRPRIFSTCAIAPITTIASRAMLKALPLYHSIYPCFTLVSFHSTPLILQPLSQKNRHEGGKKKKKTETQTREEYWQKQARQWHRAAHRTMLPFKESLVSDQTRRPLDSLTYYALKIVPITPPTCRH